MIKFIAAAFVCFFSSQTFAQGCPGRVIYNALTGQEIGCDVAVEILNLQQQATRYGRTSNSPVPVPVPVPVPMPGMGVSANSCQSSFSISLRGGGRDGAGQVNYATCLQQQAQRVQVQSTSTGVTVINNGTINVNGGSGSPVAATACDIGWNPRKDANGPFCGLFEGQNLVGRKPLNQGWK